MKEAIGGAWIYLIVLVFIAVFTCFVSITTNYSRCYRIKDEIINTIQYYRGVNEDSIGKINEYLNGIGYSATGDCPEDASINSACWHRFNTGSKDIDRYGSGTNYCIAKHSLVNTGVTSSDGTVSSTIKGPIGHVNSAYYYVAVFFKLDWPVLRSIFRITTTGETSLIYLPEDGYDIMTDDVC